MSSLPPSPPPAPGQSFGAAPAPLPPGSVPNYLVWSIISTVLGACLCCPLGLLGIVGIVFSSKVNGLLAQGDLEAAQRASKNAKTWCWVATALAIIGLLWTIYSFTFGNGAQMYQQFFEQMKAAQ